MTLEDELLEKLRPLIRDFKILTVSRSQAVSDSGVGPITYNVFIEGVPTHEFGFVEAGGVRFTLEGFDGGSVYLKGVSALNKLVQPKERR